MLLRFKSLLVRRRRSGRPSRVYHDPFFADPAVVEDDYRRMTGGSGPPGIVAAAHPDPDPAYFSRLFRGAYGRPPAAYRLDCLPWRS